jgi:hypothetical protein
LGIDNPGYRPSVEMNDLVDWHTIHAAVLSSNVPQTASLP